MPKLSNALTLIAALTLGTALYAQETTNSETEDAAQTEAAQTDAAEAEAPQTEAEEAQTQDAPADGEVTAEDNAAGSELDLGSEVVEDPTYVKEVYGDWQLKCFRSQDQEDLCQMYQLLTEEAGNPVAEVSIFKLPGDGQVIAGATIVVPLETLLTQKLLISIDGGQAKSFEYSFCSVVGCFARIGFAAADVDAFKRGANAVLQIVPAQAPDQKVNINASLKGFTAAFDNVSTIQN